MGNEIPSSHFNEAQHALFKQRLQQETQLLKTWFSDNAFSYEQKMFGYELEAWLVDHNFQPAPINERFLKALNNPLVVPELASFNIELNSQPQKLSGSVFNEMQRNLQEIYDQCRNQARLLDSDMLMIGVLPTVKETDLCLEHMSNSERYRALNEQIFRLRHGRPLHINIQGKEALITTHQDVMLEAATTSLQLHLQIPLNLAARYYNAAIILSGSIVAATGNAPYLFGKQLWEETRIPLFEQAVSIGGHRNSDEGDLKRVTFGTGYANDSLMECFIENLEHYPPVLPVLFDDPPEKLSHLRLHNGTIWRWNRPLIGFDENGQPHLRLEHRVISAGPSIIDSVANAALFVGTIKSLVERSQMAEQMISFDKARHNFYAAAHSGLAAQLHWIDGKQWNAKEHILKHIIPMAQSGLEYFDIDPQDISHYLDIITNRILTGQTGTSWQQRFTAIHGHDMQAMTAAYALNQQCGKPVHEWTI